jgi:hypothetical protein
MRATCSVDGQYFSSSSGPDTIRQRFDRLAAAAGLSRITFHDYADLRIMPMWPQECLLMKRFHPRNVGIMRVLVTDA